MLAEETAPDSVRPCTVEPNLPGGVVQKVSKTGECGDIKNVVKS